jgi:hypothetical protein
MEGVSGKVELWGALHRKRKMFRKHTWEGQACLCSMLGLGQILEQRVEGRKKGEGTNILTSVLPTSETGSTQAQKLCPETIYARLVTLSYLSFHRQALASKAFSTWLP